jgi:hypothetical protein
MVIRTIFFEMTLKSLGAHHLADSLFLTILKPFWINARNLEENGKNALKKKKGFLSVVKRSLIITKNKSPAWGLKEGN